MRKFLLATVALAPALTAQYVSPAHFTTAEGTSNNTFPFGGNAATSTPFRYVQVHDDVPAMVVQGIAFRHETVFTGTVRAPFTVTIDAWMSTAAPGITSQSASSTFDLNHGLDKLQVVTNRTISFPGNDPSLIPNDFVLDIPFDLGVVFPYLAGGSSLVWEVQLTARTNTASTPFDAVSASATGTAFSNPPLAASKAFTGCIATGKVSPMNVNPTSTAMSWPSGTGALTVNATNLENNGLIVWVNGTDRSSWGGVPLPFVVPGSTGAPSGTCTLHTDLAYLTVAIASATGTAALNLNFPVTPALHGAVIYTQVLGIDAPANPLGFTLSNLGVHQIVAPYTVPGPACRVYLGGSLGAVGTVGTTAFLVTKFY